MLLRSPPFIMTDNYSWQVYFQHSKTTFVKEWERLRDAYMQFYSYNRAIEVGTRIENLKHAVNSFLRVYKDDMPNFCLFLSKNYAFMDNNALNVLINENRLEVEKVLKIEEKQKKLQEIQEVRNNFLA
jgi:hypothetical protein